MCFKTSLRIILIQNFRLIFCTYSGWVLNIRVYVSSVISFQALIYTIYVNFIRHFMLYFIGHAYTRQLQRTLVFFEMKYLVEIILY